MGDDQGGGGHRHFDWMLAQDAAAAMPLITFRLDRRVDELKSGQRLEAGRIADHRPIYLEYEGEISGGRGWVARVATGRIVSASADSEAAGRWLLRIAWDQPDGTSGDQHLALEPQLEAQKDERWLVSCITMERFGGPR